VEWFLTLRILPIEWFLSILRNGIPFLGTLKFNRISKSTDSTLTTNQYTQKLPRNFWCPRNALYFCGIGEILLFEAANPSFSETFYSTFFEQINLNTMQITKRL
jgi:hypothetical protein